MTIEELKQVLEVVFKRHAKAVDTRGIRNAPTDWHVGQALDAVIPVLAENAKLLKVAEAAQAFTGAQCMEDRHGSYHALRKALEELGK